MKKILAYAIALGAGAYVSHTIAQSPDLFPEEAIGKTVDHMESQRHVAPVRAEEKPHSNNFMQRAEEAAERSPVGPVPQHDDPHAPTRYGISVEKKY